MSFERTGQFPARNHIRAVTLVGEDLEYGEVRIGLHRKGDMRIVEAGKRFAELSYVSRDAKISNKTAVPLAACLAEQSCLY